MSSDIDWSKREAWCIRRGQGIDFISWKERNSCDTSERSHQPSLFFKFHDSNLSLWKSTPKQGLPTSITYLRSLSKVATGVWMIAILVIVVNAIWLGSNGVYLCFPLGFQFWSRWLFSFRAFLEVFSAVGVLRRQWHWVALPGHRLLNEGGRLSNPIPLVTGSFFSPCPRCHPQKLKSLHGFLTSLNLAQAINLALFLRTYAETIVTQLFCTAKRLQIECGESRGFCRCQKCSLYCWQ